MCGALDFRYLHGILEAVVTGIYQINIGPWFYFGQSQNIALRRNQHMSELDRGVHPNSIMQRCYDKYQDFEMRVSVECDLSDIHREEQRLLDMFHGTENCMNIAHHAEAPSRGRKHTLEARRKMSATKREWYLRERPEAAKARAVKARQVAKRRQSSIIRQLRDMPLQEFHHIDGRVITCTPWELHKQHGAKRAALLRLIKGQSRQAQGWRLPSPAATPKASQPRQV